MYNIIMYSSLRKNKRVKYLSYGQNAPSYKDIDNKKVDELVKISEDTPLKSSNDITPSNLSDNNAQADVVINSNDKKPSVLPRGTPQLPEHLSYKLPTIKSPIKKSMFSIQNIIIFLFFLMLLYCLYVYANKPKAYTPGNSFFGARECASYDISRAYNIVK